jgi:transcriptional regulator with XRE-family HTH domain
MPVHLSPLERRRVAAGLSRRALAEATGISERSLVRYERAGAVPPYTKVLMIAAALGCSPEELYLDDGDRLAPV